MRSLAAAISPGYFGFTDWAFAAEAQSEMTVQVAIVTRENNALIIIFLSHFSRAMASSATYSSRAICRKLRCQNVASADVMAITKQSI
jgi:hypothetical protein